MCFCIFCVSLLYRLKKPYEPSWRPTWAQHGPQEGSQNGPNRHFTLIGALPFSASMLESLGRPIGERSGGPLEALWGPSWASLGPTWGHLGPSWGHLGAVLGHLGTILGPSWPSWGHPGSILGSSFRHVGPLGLSGVHLCPSGCHPEPHCTFCCCRCCCACCQRLDSSFRR